MGLFGGRKKSGAEKAVNAWAKKQRAELKRHANGKAVDSGDSVKELAEEVVRSVVGEPPSEERVAEIKERERLAQEGRLIRRERIAGMGVDLSVFSDAKVRRDAMSFLDEFAPTYRLLDVNVGKGRVGGDCPNLTKTGKLPKNVYEASLVAEGKRKRNVGADSLIVGIKYLRDGSVNMVDVHMWHSSVKHSVSIRKCDGDYAVTFIERYDNRSDVRDTLYLREGDAEGEPSSILEVSMRAIF